MSIGAVAVALGYPAAVALVAYLVGIGVPVVSALRPGRGRPVLRGEIVGRSLLSLGIVAAFADRHLLVSASAIAPDDVATVAAVLAVLLLPAAPRWRALATGLAVAAYLLIGMTLIVATPYDSDAVVATHAGTEFVLAGRNPYAEFDMQAQLARFHLPPEYATGLEGGGRVRSLDYPVFALLAPAPFFALGLTDIRILYLAEVLVLFALVVGSVAPALRALALAALLGNVVVLDQSVVAGVDPLWAVLLAAAWLTRRSGWSAVLIGLAVADRQPAWLVAPFLIVWAARTLGSREAARRAAVAVAVAVALHVPYLLTAPLAVIGGVTEVVVLPLEPHGIGPAGVGLAGVIPRGIFLLALVVGYAAAIWAYATRRAEGHGAPFILPLSSLWLAWRALQGYFAFIPVLGLLEEPDDG